MVLNSRPPIMVTAIEPNIASFTSGIIPRMVVMEAIITGRSLLSELDINASAGSFPDAIWSPISSISTMQFFIIIPTSPSIPTIAQNVKVLPVSSMAATTPMASSGTQQMIIAGLR